MDSWYSLLAQSAGLGLVLLVFAQLGLGVYGVYQRLGYTKSRRANALAFLRGEVDAAAARHREAAELAKTWSGYRKFTVVHKVPEAGGVCSFYLAPHDQKPLAPFRPGQFLTVRLRMPEQAKATTRCYSISCSPAERKHYRISVKAVPAPAESDVAPGLMSNYLHEAVEEGSIVDLKAPSGNFHLDLAGRRPIVLIGGGVGMTPVLSMLEGVVDQGFPRDVWLFCGVRNSEDHVFKRYLERIASAQPRLHLHVCYSQPLPHDVQGVDFQHAERVSVDLLQRVLPASNFEFYLCGPPPMMESVVPALDEWGVPDHDIYFEAFGPASIKRRGDGANGEDESVTHEVRFQKSDRTITWTPASGSLLECAEAAGMTIDAGCRAGNCGTCLTAVQSGRIDYLQEPGERPDAGTCLLCIGVPRSPVVLDA